MPADQAATEHTQPAAAQASPQGLAGGTGHAGVAQAWAAGGAGRGRPQAAAKEAPHATGRAGGCCLLPGIWGFGEIRVGE